MVEGVEGVGVLVADGRNGRSVARVRGFNEGVWPLHFTPLLSP